MSDEEIRGGALIQGPPPPAQRIVIPPQLGLMVHFVMPNGKHRPAIVVEVNSATNVDLQIFTNRMFDFENDNLIWRHHIEQDQEGMKMYSWHYREAT